MAMIIAFPKRRPEIVRGTRPTGQGQVVIFTGVRHERLNDEAVTLIQKQYRKPRINSSQNQALAEYLD